MKNTFTKKYGSFFGILLAALIGVTLSTSSTYASMAAGVTISNTATVDWAEDSSGAGSDSNTVNVTVNLVSSLVWDDTSLAPVTDIVAPGGGISYVADLLNLGNGTTNVTLTDNKIDTGLDGTEGITIAPTTAADLTLVGTVATGPGAAGGGGTWLIPVYNLNFAALEDGITRIHINGVVGTYYVVAAGSTATSLVVTGAPVVALGNQLGEVINITYSGTAAALLSSPTSGTHDHALFASDEDGVAGSNINGNPIGSDTLQSSLDGTSGTDWVTTVVAGNLAVTKYVRNDTPATPHNASGVTPLAPQYGGVDYWQSGITGNSGEVMEYLIQISNTGAGLATSVAVTDTISAFLTLDTATISIDQTSDGTFETTDAVTSGEASYNGGTRLLTVNPIGSQIASGVTTTIIIKTTIQ